jgi:hypothetical protein
MAAEGNQNLSCARYCTTRFSDISHMLSHLLCHHSHEPNFSVSCVLDSVGGKRCKTFKTLHAYKFHLYRVHQDLIRRSARSGQEVGNAKIINIESCP